MNAPRPTVCPNLIAAMIEATPDRVRRRLDRAPESAANWTWQMSEEAWSIQAGEETVTLPRSQIVSVEQLRCSCLLSPRCFHVLACLTRLEVATAEPGPTEIPEVASSAPADTIIPEERQRHAARELASNITQALRIGVANAGVVVQSGLLRAVHQCRAEGLHRLAALGLRVLAGTREIRARAATSDPDQLAEDVADLLETSVHLLRQKPVAALWVGTARRQQEPVRPRRLHGLFAEPIITRSGFTGAAVYFLGEDERIYSASDVRPGDAQHARDAYLGGIEIGPLVQPAKQLARRLYFGADLTASSDGRLGRGKDIKIVEQGPSTWQVELIEARFMRSLREQWNAVYAQAVLPADARPGGWDFIFAEGAVLAALGSELLFQATTCAQPLRLAIANESASLGFRENLRMLSHAPGLRLRLIARVEVGEPYVVYPLAAAPLASEHPHPGAPRLELPTAWGGRVCLGYDELLGKHFVHAQAAPIVLDAPVEQRDHPLACLRRRWVGSLLSGIGSPRAGNTKLLAAETAQLSRNGLATGAALLDALSRSPTDVDTSDASAFLATAIYLRNGGCELARYAVTLGA